MHRHALGRPHGAPGGSTDPRASGGAGTGACPSTRRDGTGRKAPKDGEQNWPDPTGRGEGPERWDPKDGDGTGRTPRGEAKQGKDAPTALRGAPRATRTKVEGFPSGGPGEQSAQKRPKDGSGTGRTPRGEAKQGRGRPQGPERRCVATPRGRDPVILTALPLRVAARGGAVRGPRARSPVLRIRNAVTLRGFASAGDGGRAVRAMVTCSGGEAKPTSGTDAGWAPWERAF